MSCAFILSLSYVHSEHYRILNGVWVDLFNMVQYLESHNFKVFVFCDFKYSEIPKCIYQAVLNDDVSEKILDFYEDFKDKENIIDISQLQKNKSCANKLIHQEQINNLRRSNLEINNLRRSNLEINNLERSKLERSELERSKLERSNSEQDNLSQLVVTLSEMKSKISKTISTPLIWSPSINKQPLYMKRSLQSCPHLENKTDTIDELSEIIFKTMEEIYSTLKNNKQNKIELEQNLFHIKEKQDDKILFYFTGHGENESNKSNSTLLNMNSLSLLFKNHEYFCLDDFSRFHWKTWIKKLSSLSNNYCLWIDCCHAPFTFHEDWFYTLPKYIIIPNQLDNIAWMSDKGSKSSTTLLKQLKEFNRNSLLQRENQKENTTQYNILKAPQFAFQEKENYEQLQSWFSIKS
jgi:hypothetical protein